MYGDLHIHTNISDGSLSLDETLAIVNSTHQANPVVISIVDHNIFATRSVVKRENTLIIPGIELSATEDEINVHLTAYFKDVIDTSPLGQYLQKINDGYMARARSMYEKIVSKGFAMPPFEEIRSADLPPPIYSHNMFEAFRRVNSEEVFERQKNTQLFYVEENNFLPTIKEMIDAVHTMNGIIFWAHPGTRFLKNEDDKVRINQY